MKTTIIVAIAGAVVAQNLSGEPACATSCLVSAISAAGCGPSDMACQCGPTQAAIGGLAAPCLLKACTNAADLVQAASVGTALCQSYLATATGGGVMTTAANSTMVKPTTTVKPTLGNSTTAGVVTTDATTGASNGTITTQKPTTTKATTQSTSTNAAATPMVYGAGAMVGLLGVLAAL